MKRLYKNKRRTNVQLALLSMCLTGVHYMHGMKRTLNKEETPAKRQRVVINNQAGSDRVARLKDLAALAVSNQIKESKSIDIEKLPEELRGYVTLMNNPLQFLMNRIQANDASGVSFALDHLEVTVQSKGPNGYSPLHMACAAGHCDMVKLLIQGWRADREGKAEYNYTPLHVACANGHVEVVKLLLDLGAVIGALAKGNNVELTALHIACFEGFCELAKLLISRGVSVEVFDSNGSTPLHSACANGSIELVKLLIEMKVNIQAQSKIGNTALHFACGNGQNEVVKLLIDFGLNKEAQTRGGWMPLHFACFKGHAETVKLLIQLGASIEARTTTLGDTVLHLAAPGVINLLINLGVSVDAKNNKGETALHKACINGSLEAVKLLIDKGAAINATDNQGNSPLTIACMKDKDEIIKLLIARGADIKLLVEGFKKFKSQPPMLQVPH